MNLTPEQRRAVELNDCDIVVDAGAGSGKTRVLTERIARLVLEGRTDLDRICAVTFTEKAAAEMKERLIRRLEEAGCGAEARQARGMRIGTIHSLCRHLLSENAAEAGVVPGFTVLDENEADRLLETAFDRLLEASVLNEDSGFLETVRLLGGLAPAYEKLSRALKTLRSRGDRIEDLKRRAAMTALQFAEELESLRRARCRFLGERLEAALKDRLQFVAPNKSGGKILERLNALAVFIEPIKRGERRKVSELADLFSELKLRKDGFLDEERMEKIRDAKELAKTLRPALEENPHTAGESHKMQVSVNRFLSGLWEMYEDIKAERGGFDFTDLESRALHLLESNENLTRETRRKYPYLFVDEFQDTNGLQLKLFSLLRTPGSFFVVGDVKQSIYRFRHADVDRIGGFTRRLIEEGAALIPLHLNFRSRQDLLAPINRLFREVWGDEEYNAIESFHQTDSPEARIEFAVFPSEGRSFDRRAEAEWIARRLAELFENSSCSFGDAAILLRSTTHLSAYVEALEHAGIPVKIERGKGFYEQQEILDLINLLRVVVNPHQDLPFAALLISPLAGLSDQTLLRSACSREPGESLFNTLRRIVQKEEDPLPPGELRVLKNVLESLDDLWARRGVVTAAEIVSSALTEKLSLHWMKHPRADQIWANLHKFWLHAVEHTPPQDVEGFLAEVERRIEREIAEGEAVLASGVEADAVTLTTVHSSKGLEYPIVVLPVTHHTPPEKNLLLGEELIGAKVADEENRRVDDPVRILLQQEEKAKSARESQRLFYVALTRAQKRLILTAHLNPEKELRSSGPLEEAGWDKLFLHAFRKTDPFKEETLAMEGGRVLFRAPKEAAAPPNEEKEPPPQKIFRVAEGWTGPPSPIVRANTIVEDLRRELPPPVLDRIWPVTAVAGAGEESEKEWINRSVVEGELPETGRAVGTAVHRVLESADLSTADEAKWEEILRAEAPAVKEEAIALLRDVFRSGLLKDLIASPVLKREIPFTVLLEGEILQGVIDAVFKTPEGWVIADYKTDRVALEAIAEHAESYRLQLELYALAWEKITGEPAAGLRLLFLRAGRMHTLARRDGRTVLSEMKRKIQRLSS